MAEPGLVLLLSCEELELISSSSSSSSSKFILLDIPSEIMLNKTDRIIDTESSLLSESEVINTPLLFYIVQ